MLQQYAKQEKSLKRQGYAACDFQKYEDKTYVMTYFI